VVDLINPIHCDGRGRPKLTASASTLTKAQPAKPDWRSKLRKHAANTNSELPMWDEDRWDEDRWNEDSCHAEPNDAETNANAAQKK